MGLFGFGKKPEPAKPRTLAEMLADGGAAGGKAMEAYYNSFLSEGIRQARLDLIELWKTIPEHVQQTIRPYLAPRVIDALDQTPIPPDETLKRRYWDSQDRLASRLFYAHEMTFKAGGEAAISMFFEIIELIGKLGKEEGKAFFMQECEKRMPAATLDEIAKRLAVLNQSSQS